MKFMPMKSGANFTGVAKEYLVQPCWFWDNMKTRSLISHLWYRQPARYSWVMAYFISFMLHSMILLLIYGLHSTSAPGSLLPVVYNVELVNPGVALQTGLSRKSRVSSSKALITRRSKRARGNLNSIPIWRVKREKVETESASIEKTKVPAPRLEDTATRSSVGEKIDKLTKLAAKSSMVSSRKTRVTSKVKVNTGSQKKPRNAGKVTGATEGGTAAKGSELSLARRAYFTEVWDRIRREWALPEELIKGKDTLAAILIIQIRRDGKILGAHFEKHSGNKIFDDSVWRAIWKSDPLPPFPEIYSSKEDELGIRFRLTDLLQNKR